MSIPKQWRPYGSYSNAELRVLTFPSVKEIDHAIEMIWGDPELKSLPRHYADGKTMIIPEEAIKLLAAKGLKFKVSILVDTSALSPEKLVERRKKRRHVM